MRAALQAKDTVTGRQHLAEKYLQSLAHAGLARVTSPARRGFLMQRLCELLHLPLNEVTHLLRQFTTAPAPARTQTHSPDASPSASPQAPGIPANSSGSAYPGPGEDSPHEPQASHGSQQSDPALDDLATLRPAARAAALEAQRHILGCLLMEPAWLYRELPDGRPMDEALSPAEFLLPTSRELFTCIVDRLARPALSSDSLITELTCEGRQDLVRAANESILSVERLVEADAPRGQRLLTEAAMALLSTRREMEFRRSQAATYDAQDRLQAAIDHRRRHPSPVRIPLLRPPTAQHAAQHTNQQAAERSSPTTTLPAPAVRLVQQSPSAPRPQADVP
jgi:hypothetical protein